MLANGIIHIGLWIKSTIHSGMVMHASVSCPGRGRGRVAEEGDRGERRAVENTHHAALFLQTDIKAKSSPFLDGDIFASGLQLSSDSHSDSRILSSIDHGSRGFGCQNCQIHRERPQRVTAAPATAPSHFAHNVAFALFEQPTTRRVQLSNKYKEQGLDQTLL
jgi:hypothetical protein